MGYCDHTDAELFALARERRTERLARQSAARRAVHGETRVFGGTGHEFSASHAWTGKDGLDRKSMARAVRRNAKKVAERDRKATRRCLPYSGEPRRGYITATMFDRLLRLQGFCCYICDGAFTATDGPTQDHVQPRGKGGKNSRNILLAHFHCNNRKGDNDPTPEQLARRAAIYAAVATELSAGAVTLSLPPAGPPLTPTVSEAENRKRAVFARAMKKAGRRRRIQEALRTIKKFIRRLASPILGD